jgi:hypothetical protein
MTTEHDEQAALFDWAQAHEAQYPPLKYFHAIPNGGYRAKYTAVKLKREGVKRGAPDTCLPYPTGQFHGLYIEMKTDSGRPTPEQKEWIAYLTEVGYRAVVCHGWEEAKNEIIQYLEGER